MWRFLLPVILFAGLVVIFALGLQRDPGLVPSPLIGRAAPAFVLPRLDDPEQTLTERALVGHVSLVNIWGTWCVGCHEEHDFLMSLAQDAGVRIYGINWKDDANLARDWLERLGNPYVAVGTDTDGRVAIDWGVYGAPETFLIGPDGTVLYKHIAPLTLEIWQREFAPRIAALEGVS